MLAQLPDNDKDDDDNDVEEEEDSFTLSKKGGEGIQGFGYLSSLWTKPAN